MANSEQRTIKNPTAPKALKNLKSFMSAINQLNKFITNLAQLCAPLRPLLSKAKPFKWEAHHDEAFQLIKCKIQNIFVSGNSSLWYQPLQPNKKRCKPWWPRSYFRTMRRTKYWMETNRFRLSVSKRCLTKILHEWARTTCHHVGNGTLSKLYIGT